MIGRISVHAVCSRLRWRFYSLLSFAARGNRPAGERNRCVLLHFLRFLFLLKTLSAWIGGSLEWAGKPPRRRHAAIAAVPPAAPRRLRVHTRLGLPLVRLRFRTSAPSPDPSQTVAVAVFPGVLFSKLVLSCKAHQGVPRVVRSALQLVLPLRNKLRLQFEFRQETGGI
jgi:hypothetical protein